VYKFRKSHLTALKRQQPGKSWAKEKQGDQQKGKEQLATMGVRIDQAA